MRRSAAAVGTPKANSLRNSTRQYLWFGSLGNLLASQPLVSPMPRAAASTLTGPFNQEQNARWHHCSPFTLTLIITLWCLFYFWPSPLTANLERTCSLLRFLYNFAFAACSAPFSVPRRFGWLKLDSFCTSGHGMLISKALKGILH